MSQGSNSHQMSGLNNSSFMSRSMSTSRLNHSSSSFALRDIESSFRNMSTMDSIGHQGPLQRWQRKKLEQSTASINNSMNASLQLNCTLSEGAALPCNVSLSLPSLSFHNTSSSNGGHSSNGHKTPTSTPNKLRSITPTNLSISKSGSKSGSKLTASGNKLKIGGNGKGAKTPKTTPGHDRFIPDRNHLNVDVSHYLINSTNQENEGANEDEAAVGAQPRLARTEMEQANRRALSEALNGDLSAFRIIPTHGMSMNNPKSASKYGLNVSGSKSGHKKSSRSIPSAPERILDAPEVTDDFYLQLLSWSDSIGDKGTNGEKGLLAVALNREVYIWNATTGDITNLLELPGGDYVTSLSWAPESAYIAVGTYSNCIQLWDVSSGKKLRTFHDLGSRVSSLAWNHNVLTSGYKTGDIKNFDVTQARHQLGNMNHHVQEICGLKWNQDGRLLASGSNDNTVKIWSNTDLSSNSLQPQRSLNSHTAAVKAIDWCPWKPSLLATGGGTADKMLKIWNANNGECLHSVDTKSQVSSVLWSEEHHELITGHGYCNNELIIWKYPTMSKVAELNGHSARILGMAMSPDGETVVSLGADETLRFWDCFKSSQERSKVKENKFSASNDLSMGSMRMIR